MARSPAPCSPRPRLHHAAAAVVTRATTITATKPDTCHRIPAAVTAQLVSAAGTRRRSSLACAAVHRSHAWTSSRSFSSRAGPMPSTSPSWSTLLKRPLASRHATIAAAVTGPMPGRASSCSADATVEIDQTLWCCGVSGRGRGGRRRRGRTRLRADRAAHGGRLARAQARFRRRSVHRRRRVWPYSVRAGLPRRAARLRR